MMLSQATPEVVKSIDRRSGPELRNYLIEYLNGERLKIMQRMSREEMESEIRRCQGASMVLEELVKILASAPAHHRQQNEQDQFHPPPGGATY